MQCDQKLHCKARCSFDLRLRMVSFDAEHKPGVVRPMRRQQAATAKSHCRLASSCPSRPALPHVLPCLSPSCRLAPTCLKVKKSKMGKRRKGIKLTSASRRATRMCESKTAVATIQEIDIVKHSEAHETKETDAWWLWDVRRGVWLLQVCGRG